MGGGKAVCKPGYVCPRGTFSEEFASMGNDVVKCRSGYGLYCPAGTSKFNQKCRKGNYCPSPTEQIECPEGYYWY